MAQGFEQKRECPRASYPLKVSCLGEYQVFEARTDNISLSGACLQTSVEFGPGKSLGIILKLPGARKLFVIPAEVVWSQACAAEDGGVQYQLGIKYLYLLPDVREIFRALLSVLQAG